MYQSMTGLTSESKHTYSSQKAALYDLLDHKPLVP